MCACVGVHECVWVSVCACTHEHACACPCACAHACEPTTSPSPNPRMQSVSNQQLKPEEVERYFRHTERANRKPMSRKEVAQAKGRITEALK